MPNPNFVDLTGQTFGYWVVLERGENYRGGKARWLCRCDCGRCDGEIRQVDGTGLRSGYSKSCGASNTRHGHTSGGRSSPTYRSWEAMRNRCTNPNHISWASYGGRGISVDPRWDSFTTFLADMGPRPEGMTLDRINNDGSFEPGNCRWVSYKTQRHGHTSGGKSSPTYTTWECLRQRCTRPSDVAWAYYGGRGVSYDPAWNDFTVFLSDMGERPEGKTIDRIDVDGPYSKSNCRWATAKEQRANQRNSTTPARVGCVVDGCERPHKARGWCEPHYMRWWRSGDPLTPSGRTSLVVSEP